MLVGIIKSLLDPPFQVTLVAFLDYFVFICSNKGNRPLTGSPPLDGRISVESEEREINY